MDNTSKRKLSEHLFILYLIAILLIILGQMLGMLLGFLPFMTSTDIAITIYMYLSFIGIWYCIW